MLAPTIVILVVTSLLCMVDVTMIVGLFKRKASLLVPWLAFAGIYLLLTTGFVIFFVAKAGQPIEYTIGNQTYDLNKWLNDNLMIPEIQLKQSAQVKSSKMTGKYHYFNFYIYFFSLFVSMSI